MREQVEVESLVFGQRGRVREDSCNTGAVERSLADSTMHHRVVDLDEQ
jgi:hypothetical protein